MLVLFINLKKNVKVFTSKSVWTGSSSYKKRIYRVAVSQRLRDTALPRTELSHPLIVDMDWVLVAYDCVRWPVVLNTVMNPLVL